MELMEAIKNRRSIRIFSDQFVTDAEIRYVIDAAHCAPSWANTQVWEFIVVREKELISQVTDTYSEFNPARKCSVASSALIVVCAKTGVSGYKDGKVITKFHEWFMFDLGMAVQNLCLRAHEIGLGTVVVGHLNHDACKKLLLLPDGYDVVTVIPIGKPAAPVERIPTRKDLKTFVYLNKFGEHYGKIY
jgi:nitroreductase